MHKHHHQHLKKQKTEGQRAKTLAKLKDLNSQLAALDERDSNLTKAEKAESQEWARVARAAAKGKPRGRGSNAAGSSG